MWSNFPEIIPCDISGILGQQIWFQFYLSLNNSGTFWNQNPRRRRRRKRRKKRKTLRHHLRRVWRLMRRPIEDTWWLRWFCGKYARKPGNHGKPVVFRNGNTNLKPFLQRCLAMFGHCLAIVFVWAGWSMFAASKGNEDLLDLDFFVCQRWWVHWQLKRPGA